MKTDVLVEPLPDNRWRATGLRFLTISGEGKTRDEAIHNFQLAAVRQISRGTSVVSIEIDAEGEIQQRHWQAAVQLYQTQLKALVEPQYLGQFIVVDPVSGDYEVDRDDLIAEDRLLQRRPNSLPVLITIGQDHAFVL